MATQSFSVLARMQGMLVHGVYIQRYFEEAGFQKMSLQLSHCFVAGLYEHGPFFSLFPAWFYFIDRAYFYHAVVHCFL